MVGPPGFEPGSNAPKASSIDQTNPRAPCPRGQCIWDEGYWAHPHISSPARKSIPSLSASLISSQTSMSISSFSANELLTDSRVMIPSDPVASLIAEIMESKLCPSLLLALICLDSALESFSISSAEISLGRFDLDTASASFSGDWYEETVMISLLLEHLLQDDLLPSDEPKKFPQGHLRRSQLSPMQLGVVQGSRG